MSELEEKKKRKKAGTEYKRKEGGKGKNSLRQWFKRKGAKGKKGGWVDCNAPDGKGGYKSCGRSSGEKRKKYPSCRPTPGACKEKGRGKSWGKKGSKKRNESMKLSNEELRVIIIEELQNVLDEKKGNKRQRKKKAKKKTKKDACYHKVKRRYKVWPSAYASGALVKCRKVGAKNWGNKSKKNEQLTLEYNLDTFLQERINKKNTLLNEAEINISSDGISVKTEFEKWGAIRGISILAITQAAMVATLYAGWEGTLIMVAASIIPALSSMLPFLAIGTYTMYVRIPLFRSLMNWLFKKIGGETLKTMKASVDLVIEKMVQSSEGLMTKKDAAQLYILITKQVIKNKKFRKKMINMLLAMKNNDKEKISLLSSELDDLVEEIIRSEVLETSKDLDKQETIVEKKNCGCGLNPCKTYGKLNEEFKPHDMYDPKTGKKEKTKVEKDHERLAKKGYVHVDPEEIEDILNDEGGAAGLDPFTDELGSDLEAEILKALGEMPNVGKHESGDYILDDDEEIDIVKEQEMEEAKKKKPCKPSKGKRFAKRVNGKCRSFGQKGQAKVVVTESAPEQRKVMLTVLVLLELKNVRIHPAPMPSQERSGNAEERNQ